MRLDKAFGTDTSLEEDGKWFDIGDGARIRIARFGNESHKKILLRLRDPYKALLLRGGQIPDDVNDDIITESMAQTILLDWEGMFDQDNEAIPFSAEAARTSFKLYKDFLELVSQLSLNAANFRTETQEEIVKKSESS